jgi:tRNA threonylcarbamoyladenosine modification (KEOPS) complex  Pcc1 subunit
MKAECKIILCYDSEKKAEQVFKSIKVDDFDFVKSSVEKCCLKAKIQSGGISSLLHTLDDYLSCVGVADDIVDKN